MIINLANEWGPTNSTAWQYAYQYQSGSISSVAGNTVTLSTISATNPFANCPFALLSGVAGLSTQVVSIASTGGTSGAWTITASSISAADARSIAGTMHRSPQSHRQLPTAIRRLPPEGSISLHERCQR